MPQDYHGEHAVSLYFANVSRMPVWVTFAVVVGGLILVVIGGIVSALFTWNATSVLVYRTRENSLYYEFWSSDYQEYLKVGAKDEKRESA